MDGLAGVQARIQEIESRFGVRGRGWRARDATERERPDRIVDRQLRRAARERAVDRQRRSVGAGELGIAQPRGRRPGAVGPRLPHEDRDADHVRKRAGDQGVGTGRGHGGAVQPARHHAVGLSRRTKVVVCLRSSPPVKGPKFPGFLAPWLELPGVTDAVTWWSAVLDLDLARLGTTADADEIKDTAIAQPLLVGAGLAAASVLFPDGQPQFGIPRSSRPAGCRTPSMTSRATSVPSPATASVRSLRPRSRCAFPPKPRLVLVRERGRAMASAAAATPTGMTAILGGDAEAVLAKLAELGLTPANVNAAGQVVAAGTVEQLAALAADPARGRPVTARSRSLARSTPRTWPPPSNGCASSPRRPADLEPGTLLLSNADGSVIQHGPRVPSAGWLSRSLRRCAGIAA